MTTTPGRVGAPAGGRPGIARGGRRRTSPDRPGWRRALVRRPRFTALTAAVVTAAILILPAGPAAAAGPGRAMVRVAHFSPDASYVDVYMVSLNRRQLFPNVFYKSVSSYWAVAAGPFTYEVRAA